jgi:hypothetical protein
MDDVADDDYFQRAMAVDEEIDEDFELIEALNERRHAYIFHVRTNFHFESKLLKNLPCFATIFHLRRTIPPQIPPQSGGGHVDLQSNCRLPARDTIVHSSSVSVASRVSTKASSSKPAKPNDTDDSDETGDEIGNKKQAATKRSNANAQNLKVLENCFAGVLSNFVISGSRSRRARNAIGDIDAKRRNWTS